ncbi:recombinase family protein [Streptomyces prasinus]|uniref:recombinase family protein n=2 Tax=Streptomyces TaxID=1883 RepID=UPI003328D2C0
MRATSTCALTGPEAVTEAGCVRIFMDKKSGKNAEREELRKATLDCLRPGAPLVVPSLDRLSRSTQELTAIMSRLRKSISRSDRIYDPGARRSSTGSRGARYSRDMAADETSIKVSVAARDRLAMLASEHGTTIRGLVEDLAQGTPTQAEYAERAELARAELSSALGTAPSPEAEEKARALLERLGGTQHAPGAAA